VFNSNLPFGPDKAQALLLVADSTETRYTYRIHQLPWDNKEIRWWRVSDIEGRVQSQRDRFPRISAASSNEAAFLEMSDRAAPRRPIASVEIPIPMATLVPGRYQIDLVKAGTRDTIAVKFQIVWEMMPFSLRTLDYAIESMQFICSEETLDSLTDGDAAQNRQALMEWWRRQDQTATTVYNERMAEYYRRVDNAYFAFSTINEPDGSRTERGKVYVLYGQPSSITKDLKAASPREVWKYTNVPKQTFTFEVNDRGVYRLVDVK
jgi:GWxTD domain-containing protein